MEPVLQTCSPAPEFTLFDLDGQPVRLADHRGRIVVIYFWSAECAWCRRVDEAFSRLVQNWARQVTLLAISANQEESPAVIQREAQARGIRLVLRDPDQQTARRYGALTTPHIFILDENGLLRYQGAFDDVTFRRRNATRNYVDEAVQALLSGRSPNPSQTTPYGCALSYHHRS